MKSHNAKVAGATYTVTGIIEAVDSTTLRITELPIRRWTQDFKEFIESVTLDPKNKDKETFIEVVIMEKTFTWVCNVLYLITIILQLELFYRTAQCKGIVMMFTLCSS